MVGRALATALLLFAVTGHAEAQVLATAETLGKGKSAVLFSDNVIVPGEGIANLNNAFGQFARGVSERLDLYIVAGGITTEGSTQTWVAGGGNLRIARMGKAAVSVFGLATIPLTHRDEACQVLLNPAVIVSAPLGPRLSVYSGVNALVPLGDRARGVFTPPSTKANVPIGAAYAFGPWGIWGEADIGPLRAFGVGLTRIW